MDEHNFLYAFAAKGFRPGGLNVPVGLRTPAPFDEELVTNYELGWKAGWLDGAVRTQMNVYYNDYDGFQVTVGYPDFPTFGFELNNPNTTKISGFEAQLEAVFDDLSIDAGLGWMKSELGGFLATDPRIGGLLPCDQRYVAAINSGLRFAGPPRQFGIRVMKVF